MAIEYCSIGRGLASIQHKTNKRSFTYYTTLSLKEEFDVFEGEGTLFGSMSGAGFKAIKISLPPPEVIDAFESLCYPIDQQIEINEKQNQTLTSIRDTLLPKLLSGEIRVGQAEKTVEEAL